MFLFFQIHIVKHVILVYVYEIYVCYIVVSGEIIPGKEYVKEGDHATMLICGV